MLDVTAPIDPSTRAGRMLQALIDSKNRNAKVVLTTALVGPDAQLAMHQTFQVKGWNGRSGRMLTVEVTGSGDWASGVRPIKMFHVDLETQKIVPARDPRNENPLLRYAADAALAYAWRGEAGLPSPRNGSVTVLESDNCGMCGRELTDPISIERGIGPECASKATGARTITGRR